MARIDLWIPEDILKEVDFYRYFTKEDKSAFMTKASRSYFKIIERQILDKKRKKAIEDIKDSRKRLAHGLSGWDSTGDIRELRESRRSS